MDSGIGGSEFSDSSVTLRLDMEIAGVAEFGFSLISSHSLNTFNVFVGSPCLRDSSKLCWGSSVACFCVDCSASHSSCSSILPGTNHNVSVPVDVGPQFIKLAFHREPPLQLSDTQTFQV